MELEEEYDDFLNSLEDTSELTGNIQAFYEDVNSTNICSIANGAFNSLDEAYQEYEQHFETIQNNFCKYEDQYKMCSNLILEIETTMPTYEDDNDDTLYDDPSEEFVSSLENKFQKSKAQFENHYASICEIKQSYLDEEKEMTDLHLQAQEIADDFFNRDYDLMCRIVYAEAGICPSIEHYYVANVIENRLASPNFPNTIHGVVYSPGQYEPVMIGTINNTPSRLVKQNVEDYLRGHVETGMPSNVIYQARFPQGSGTWKHMASGHYYCYY